MYNKAHLIRSTTLGRHHPETAASHFNLGRLLNRMGDFDRALDEFQSALEIYDSLFGRNHKKVADIFFMISKVLSKKGDHKNALLECEKAHEIYEGLQNPKKGATAAFLVKFKKRMEEAEKRIPDNNRYL